MFWSLAALMVAVGALALPLTAGRSDDDALPNYLIHDSPARVDYAESLGLPPSAVTFELDAAMELDEAEVALCDGPSRPAFPPGYETTVPVECERPIDGGFGLVVGLISAGLVALGGAIIIASRNPWGRNVLYAGMLLVVFILAEIYAEQALVLDPGSLPLGDAVLLFGAGTGWVVLGVIIGPRLVLTFPTGSPPSNRWRWIIWMSYLAAAVLLMAQALQPVHPYSINPIQVMSIEASTRLFDLGIMTWTFLVLFPSLVALFVRFWRSEGEERLQLKWVAFAAVLAILANLVQTILGSQDVLGPIAAFFSFIILPGAILISIFKYRLYDIDRIISRTFGYTLVILALGAIYVVGAVWLPTLVTGQESPPLFVAASTVLVAYLFNPLRKRVLAGVDRRFNRTRYAPELVLSHLNSLLSNLTELSEVVQIWEDAVTDSLQPSSLGVWVRER